MKNYKASGSAGFLGSLRSSGRGTALALLGGLLLSSVSVAAAPAPGPDLKKWREVSRVTGQKAYGGAAKVNVDAPQDVVRSVVLDYKNYAKFISRFEKSQVVGRKGDTTDVYLRVPILKGAANVWAVVRFGPITPVEGGWELVGHKVDSEKEKTGNVKRLDAKWSVKKLDDSSTEVALELVIVPEISLPGGSGLVSPEVAYAAAKAVEGSRDEAEKRKPH